MIAAGPRAPRARAPADVASDYPATVMESYVAGLPVSLPSRNRQPTTTAGRDAGRPGAAGRAGARCAAARPAAAAAAPPAPAAAAAPPPPPPLPHAPPLPRPPPLPLAADPAFTGPIGEYARLAGSLTEADPFAVLVTALTGAATMIGPGPYVRTGDTVHPPVLFALLIAETPKANRGMSWRLARQLLDAAAPGGAAGSVVQGLSGDSGLIGALGLRGRRAARRALPRGARSCPGP